MTVRAEQSEVLDSIIAPIAVDVLDLNRNAAGLGMFLIPSAPTAAFSVAMYQVFTHKAIAVIDPTIAPAFKYLAAPLELTGTMTFVRTEGLLCKCDGLTAHFAGGEESTDNAQAPFGAMHRAVLMLATL
jgi:hypothetical protein